MSLTRTLRPLFRARPAAALSSVASVRGKHTLPDLSYDYGELEPAISGKIMELHYTKHHQTYVNSLNDAEEKYAQAVHSQNTSAQIALQPLLKFHGGGHINHTLFWENLSPSHALGGKPPTDSLASAINENWGSFDKFKSVFNTSLAGIQGSGWTWLVKDKTTGVLSIVNYANQDPVVGNFTPIMGIDAWEHAYYLQYENRKAEYFKSVWDVVNWKVAGERFGA